MRTPDSILPVATEGLGFSAGGVAILSGVTLRIEAGPPTVIVGPNGAGKSVLLRLLHGLLAPTAGRLIWPVEAPVVQRRQAMVFQRPVLLRRSVLGNVTYPLHRLGLPRADRLERAWAALALVGLVPLAGRAARLLSGGEQQRLALARAAAFGPELLFLDEPCASLDPAATRAVETIVATLSARGTKVVLTTHDLGQARRLAGEILFLHRGQLHEHAPAARFFAGPTTVEAAAFLRGDLVW